MLQFSEQEISAIKQRATQSTIQALIDNNQVVLNTDTLVPPDGRATWNLYYFCPEHGVRLTWDRDKPTSHICLWMAKSSPVSPMTAHGGAG